MKEFHELIPCWTPLSVTFNSRTILLSFFSLKLNGIAEPEYLMTHYYQLFEACEYVPKQCIYNFGEIIGTKHFQASTLYISSLSEVLTPSKQNVPSKSQEFLSIFCNRIIYYVSNKFSSPKNFCSTLSCRFAFHCSSDVWITQVRYSTNNAFLSRVLIFQFNDIFIIDDGTLLQISIFSIARIALGPFKTPENHGCGSNDNLAFNMR